MRLRRSLAAVLLLGVVVGLPMCGSEDAKKHVSSAAGEGGEPGAAGDSPSAGGSDAATNQGGAGAGSVDTPVGGAGDGPGGSGGAASSAGQSGHAQVADAGAAGTPGAAGAPGAGGEAAFCAVDTTSCCSPDEPSCDSDWSTVCGQNFNSYSCCDNGVRQTCSVPYFEGNYHVMWGSEECACNTGSCDCACVKGSACPYQEADCNSTSWTDACVQGNSPTCCDSANGGIRQKCVYNGGKTFTSSPVIDACTGEGFGTAACTTCLNGQDPPCEQTFFDACNSDVSHCSDSSIGYRMSCQDGLNTVLCTCDPNLIIDF